MSKSARVENSPRTSRGVVFNFGLQGIGRASDGPCYLGTLVGGIALSTVRIDAEDGTEGPSYSIGMDNVYLVSYELSDGALGFSQDIAFDAETVRAH